MLTCVVWLKRSTWLLVYLGFLSSAVAQVAQSPVANAPVLKVGQLWKFHWTDLLNNGPSFWYTEEVTEASDSEAMLLRTRGLDKQPDAPPVLSWWLYDVPQGRHVARFAYNEKSALHKRGRKTNDYSAQPALLQFPLQVGKNWEVTENWKTRSGEGHTDWKVAVRGFESIKTAAGEFDAFRVTFIGYPGLNKAGSSPMYRQERIFWYAPQVQRVVRNEFVARAGTRMLLQEHWIEDIVEYKAP